MKTRTQAIEVKGIDDRDATAPYEEQLRDMTDRAIIYVFHNVVQMASRKDYQIIRVMENYALFRIRVRLPELYKEQDDLWAQAVACANELEHRGIKQMGLLEQIGRCKP
jgi:hypothetical protein